MDDSQSFSEQTPVIGPKFTYDGKDTFNFETNSKSTVSVHKMQYCQVFDP